LGLNTVRPGVFDPGLTSGIGPPPVEQRAVYKSALPESNIEPTAIEHLEIANLLT
jgi:hypothetical protein